MRTTPATATARDGGQPLLHQSSEQTQLYGTVEQLPVGLGHDVRMYACQRLNQVLADTQILYSL